MFTANEILQKVNQYIDQLQYDRNPHSLYEPIKYVLALGGKRIRPVLMLMAYNLYKENPETILPQACALETYHNYTLLHDDLMDKAPMRRGKPTVHEKWDDNTAILSGDAMLVLAFQRMAGCEDKYLRKVIDILSLAALEVSEGQQYDMEFERRTDVSEEEYIEMIRLKTSVLLARALEMGAVLADASEEDVRNLYFFGEKIGLAFQLQDDYLDVYGDPKIFGKKIGGDILSNKKTYMLINALLNAGDVERKELSRWMTLDEFDADEKIKAVTRIYSEVGIDKLAQDKMAYYFEEANKYLAAVRVENEKKNELIAFAESLMHRVK